MSLPRLRKRLSARINVTPPTSSKLFSNAVPPMTSVEITHFNVPILPSRVLWYRYSRTPQIFDISLCYGKIKDELKELFFPFTTVLSTYSQEPLRFFFQGFHMENYRILTEAGVRKLEARGAKVPCPVKKKINGTALRATCCWLHRKQDVPRETFFRSLKFPINFNMLIKSRRRGAFSAEKSHYQKNSK